MDPLLAGCGLAEDCITGLEPGDAAPHRVDDPRHVRPGDSVLGAKKPPTHEAEDDGTPGHDMPDVRVYRGGTDPYEDLFLARYRLFDLLELEVFVGPIPILDDGFQGALVLTTWESRISTVFMATS
jgi:hypothetical protein